MQVTQSCHFIVSHLATLGFATEKEIGTRCTDTNKRNFTQS